MLFAYHNSGFRFRRQIETLYYSMGDLFVLVLSKHDGRILMSIYSLACKGDQHSFTYGLVGPRNKGLNVDC